MPDSGTSAQIQEDSANSTAEISVQSPPLSIGNERQCLVELKNGKVTLKQKVFSFEKQSETLQEIVKFREFLQSMMEKKCPPLSEIPDEHKPLIAKMAHESDKTLSTLARYIRLEVLPTQNEDNSSTVSDALSTSVVESAIKSIMNRNNYGLSPPNGGKAPAALCLWRWEVKAEYWDWLPKSGREKAEQRLAERACAKNNLQAMFDALPQDEQRAILDPKAIKTQAKVANSELSSDASPSKAGKTAQAQAQVKQEDDANVIRAKASRLKKAPDPEKLAKEKERTDKKVAKAEKERREKDAQNKSRSIMANFFSKKAPATKVSVHDTNNEGPNPLDNQSEFSRTFKPFLVKKDAQMASANWFLDRKSKSKGKFVPRMLRKEVITIDDNDDDGDDGDIIMVEPPTPTLHVGTMETKERLVSILSTLPPSVDPSCTRSKPLRSYKTCHPISVREVMSQLSEAEIAGDDNLVRSLVAKLRSRTVFPIKVFIFHEDARPGYFGTWTRSSQVVGTRTPLAKDLTIADYSYDSGEEWEDEGNADADDVVDDDDEEVMDEEVDSDLDSWLVDDEEVSVSPGDVDSWAPEIPESAFSSSKRKVEHGEKKSGKKRKLVVPLAPFAKGPCWESTIGHCDYAPFTAYKIRLFNDTPFPVDPFAFVAIGMDDRKPSQNGHGEAQYGSRLSNCPPNHAASLLSKKPAIAPKNAFPDTHLPFLLTKITTLQAASLTFLVETVYQELRVHKVKKNAIEAKVREVGEKCKEKRIWVVKSTVEPDHAIV